MTQPQATPPAQIAAASAAATALIAGAVAAQTPEALVSGVSTRTALAISGIATTTKSVLQSMWSTVNPYDPTSVSDFVKAANPVLVAAQKATGTTAAGAQTAMLRALGVNAAAPVLKLPDDIRVQHADAIAVSYDDGAKPDVTVHVTPQDASNTAILERPAKAFRYQESIGKPRDQALQISVTRLDDVVDGNLLIAQRDAEHQALNVKILDYHGNPVRSRSEKILGYRRIIHPEFSTGGVCGLCVAASDRLYQRQTLRPIHLRCKCTSAPVTTTYDPGQTLNGGDLSRLYSDAGDSTSAADLKKTRYDVVYNELGPTLVAADGETVPYFSTTPPVINLDEPPQKRLADRPAPGDTRNLEREELPRTVSGGGNEPPKIPPTGGHNVQGDDETPDERLTRLFRHQSDSATDEQRSSVRRWQGKDDRFYQQVQDAISGVDTHVSSEALDVAEDLRDAMVPLPEDAEVWRGVRDVERALGVPVAEVETLGGSDGFQLGRFFATSTSRDVAQNEFTDPGQRPALYKITALAGTPALWVPPLGDADNVYQQELLFPPDAVVRILHVDRSGDIPVLTMEVSYGEVG